jgi:hypothetical protein
MRMARNKLASAARHQFRQRRDPRREAGGEQMLANLAADEPSPSALVAGRELLQRFLEGFSAEERRLAELRGLGVPWAEAARQLGGTAEARRMQLTRAVARVAHQLGMDDDGDE